MSVIEEFSIKGFNVHYVFIQGDNFIFLPYSSKNFYIGKDLKLIKAHNDNITSLIPYDDNIASYSWDGTIKIWDSEGNLLKTLIGHSKAVQYIKYHKNKLYSCSFNEIFIWGEEKKYIENIYDDIQSINIIDDKIITLHHGGCVYDIINDIKIADYVEIIDVIDDKLVIIDCEVKLKIINVNGEIIKEIDIKYNNFNMRVINNYIYINEHESIHIYDDELNFIKTLKFDNGIHLISFYNDKLICLDYFNNIKVIDDGLIPIK